MIERYTNPSGTVEYVRKIQLSAVRLIKRISSYLCIMTCFKMNITEKQRCWNMWKYKNNES